MNDAISGNNNVAVAKARVREARAGLGQTVGSLLPSVSSSISGTRNGSEQSDASLSQYRSGFDASWELDFLVGISGQLKLRIMVLKPLWKICVLPW